MIASSSSLKLFLEILHIYNSQSSNSSKAIELLVYAFHLVFTH
jgi:hypothetical protein